MMSHVDLIKFEFEIRLGISGLKVSQIALKEHKMAKNQLVGFLFFWGKIEIVVYGKKIIEKSSKYQLVS